jgi:hypothetical protein
MFETSEDILSQLLEGTVDELDITVALHEAADAQYQRVGQFLSDQSDDGPTEWDVYPQGSFLLGTVVRPRGADHHDLDMVCRLDIGRASISQAELKARVGDVLHRYLDAEAGEPGAPTACHDRRRCWTLEYPHAFHMDVLPSLPNEDDLPDGICLTDKELFRWQKSNPIAYGEWFRERMALEVARRREEMVAKRLDPVPAWQIKTTLQRVAQVLKRHRDIHFGDDLDGRPPSILVTTLAARAYTGARDLFDAVMDVAAKMPELVEHSDGVWRVMNPVAEENFADKWNEHPDRVDKFFAWRDKLAADLDEAKAAQGLDRVTARLAESFGAEPVTKAAGRVATSFRTTAEEGRLKAAASGLLSTGTGTPVRKHGFYGSRRP